MTNDRHFRTYCYKHETQVHQEKHVHEMFVPLYPNLYSKTGLRRVSKNKKNINIFHLNIFIFVASENLLHGHVLNWNFSTEKANPIIYCKL